MIETTDGLRNVAEICAVPGIDGVYVGPSDLSLVLGARYPGDERIAEVFQTALEQIVAAARLAGISAGIHCVSGEQAAERLAMGFTFASVASDITHLEQIVTEHLDQFRARQIQTNN